jgi:hypothetical protein
VSITLEFASGNRARFKVDDPAVVVTLTLDLYGEAVGLEIHGTHLTARLIREVPFGELARLARSARPHGSGPVTPVEKAAPHHRDRGDKYYARLAIEYEAWTATGEKLTALASRLGIRSVHTLRSQLATAKRRGLLAGVAHGRAGGWATDKARLLVGELSATPWSWTDDPDAPCSYCVQWRCAECHQDPCDYDKCPKPDWDFEPYMPDGSIPPLLYRIPHKECQEAVDFYMEEARKDAT